MDPRVDLYKNAFGGRQIGGGSYIPKFYGSHRYQNGGGDVMRGLLRRFWPVAKQGFAAFIRAGGESMKERATWKEALKSSIKPTIGAVPYATADQITDKSQPPRLLQGRPSPTQSRCSLKIRAAAAVVVVSREAAVLNAVAVAQGIKRRNRAARKVSAC